MIEEQKNPKAFCQPHNLSFGQFSLWFDMMSFSHSPKPVCHSRFAIRASSPYEPVRNMSEYEI